MELVWLGHCMRSETCTDTLHESLACIEYGFCETPRDTQFSNGTEIHCTFLSFFAVLGQGACTCSPLGCQKFQTCTCTAHCSQNMSDPRVLESFLVPCQEKDSEQIERKLSTETYHTSVTIKSQNEMLLLQTEDCHTNHMTMYFCTSSINILLAVEAFDCIIIISS